MAERKLRQNAFIRVCKDSGFSLDTYRAAAMAAGVVGVHPLEIWTAFAGLDQMHDISAGTHPAVQDKRKTGQEPVNLGVRP